MYFVSAIVGAAAAGLWIASAVLSESDARFVISCAFAGVFVAFALGSLVEFAKDGE